MNIYKYISFCFYLLLLTACNNLKSNKELVKSKDDNTLVNVDLKWSERMALSEIHRFPDPTLLDFQKKPRWSYTNGLVLQAMSREYERSKNQTIYNYIYDYANRLVLEDGTIETYKMSNYNLDMIKSGDVLYYLYDKTKEERFKLAMDNLHLQLLDQPTTSEGGYWHKKRYPYQMWLDGVYMAEPFHAKYIQSFMSGDEAETAWKKVIKQFDLIEKHSRDSITGLYYHGWDESKEQLWANKESGLSQHFWSRGMGWYSMALVDIIEYIPDNDPARNRIIGYLNRFAESIVQYQDSSGTWYQVIGLAEREGNYKEATGTCMFTYTLSKGVQRGYLPQKYMTFAEKAYKGIHQEFITVDDDGMVNLNQCCAVAGLGGDPYRDGSYEYYISEEIRSNDPKGTGPFIMASLILDK